MKNDMSALSWLTIRDDLFNQFNYLVDTLSVAPLVKGRSDVTVS